jgi:glycosyltransferase EpsF
MKKLKILQYTGAMNRAGAETLLMNIYRNIDRTKFEFHFITHVNEKCDYDDEIVKLGGKIIYLERPNIKKLNKFSKDFKAIIDEYGPYDAFHAHMQLLNGIVLKEAQDNNIKIRISHAHLNGDYSKSSILRKLYENYSKYLINRYSTHRLSCSYKSGEYLYKSNSFNLVSNAVDINQFKFNDKDSYIYDELNLDKDMKLITHIGRFVEAKNHKFIIDIFNEVIKKDKKYRLLLVGKGELIDLIKNKVKENNLENYVYFLGLRSDINKILASTDVFFMPSILEGLPVVLVEAQAGGISCIISDNIPEECDMGLNLITSLSLNDDIEMWARTIIKSVRLDIKFEVRKDKIIKSGYDLENNVRFMGELYSSNILLKPKNS